MFDDRDRLVRYVLIGVLLAVLFASSCRHVDDSSDLDAEVRFRELFGSTLTDKLAMHTDKHRYRYNDTIGYWVENGTDVDLWFQDQSFGVRAFAYDGTSEGWVELDLGSRVSDPRAILIESGHGAVLDFYSLWIERIDVAEDGRIRLTITGHTDLTNPAQDRIYVGYTDVQVVK